MGRIFNGVDEYLIALDIAIAQAMPNEVYEKIVDEANDSAEQIVYSYSPKFISRRKDNKGIVDKDNYDMIYNDSTKTLTVSNITKWQHLYGGEYPQNDLSSVIENNQIYGAPKRPFMRETEKAIQKGKVDKALQRALIIRGF